MSLLDKLLGRAKNRKFMEAVSAGCALVACADGIVRPEETAKLIEFISLDEDMRAFDSLQIIETFDKYVQMLEYDFRIGKEKVFNAVRNIRENREESGLLILVCCAIGKADEDFDNNQRLMIRELCRELSLNPDKFDLNLKAPSPAKLPKPPPIRQINMPEWMKHPPELIKSPSPEPSSNMPEWMRNPPKAPKSSMTENIPAWMREPSGMRVSDNKVNHHHPDWMKNPPQASPSKKNSESNIPDWMKNPIKNP